MLYIYIGYNHGLLLGVSIAVTFLVTTVFSTLLTVMVTLCLCVHKKKIKPTPSEPGVLSNKLFEAAAASLKMSPKTSSARFGVDKSTAL